MKTVNPKEKHIKSIKNKKPAKHASAEAKLEKFLKKNTKILASIKPILNEAASLYASISKTCPAEYATKLQDKLIKQLKVTIFQENVVNPIRFCIGFNVFSKNMSIPANNYQHQPK